MTTPDARFLKPALAYAQEKVDTLREITAKLGIPAGEKLDKELDSMRKNLLVAFAAGAEHGAGDQRKIYADEIFEKIQHGDEAHKKWLREALDNWAVEGR